MFMQPSAEVFEMFDSVLLLSQGRVIYRGTTSKAVSFFQNAPSLNISFREYTNPAEFLTDLAGGLTKNEMVIYEFDYRSSVINL